VRFRNTPFDTQAYANGGAFARVSTRYHADNPNYGSVNSGGPLAADRALLYREQNTSTGLYTYGAYLQDNYSRGRLRLNLGVRWDYQDDEARAGCVEANPLVPDLLPAQCFDGADAGKAFSDISPRLSATYDLFGTGKTVLKGGFAQYYGQGVGLSNGLSLLGGVTMTFQNTPTRTCWDDVNGDMFVQANELNLANPDCGSLPSNFDRETLLRTTSLDEVDPNLKNDRTTEFSAGVEHELFPNFAVGVNYIRRTYDQFRSDIRIGETKDMWIAREWTDADFIAEGEPSPGSLGLPSSGWIYYEFNPNLVRPANIELTQNVTEERTYDGVDFTVTKRFSDRWSMNAAITVQKRIEDPDFCFDCTNLDKTFGINDITKYIVKLNGSYALPGGWNASANLQMAQGQNRNITIDGPPSGYRSGGISSTTGNPLTLGGQGLNFTVNPYGTEREPLEHLLDAQVTKSFDLRGGRNRLNLVMSVFNVLNANTVRGYRNNQSLSNFGEVTSILAPRVARIQAAISF
jgi:hypothetical protein